MSCISFLNTCPSSGDTEQQLLSKILQVINTTGGGIAGVSSISINGGAPQTGAVSITTGGTVTSVNGDPGPAVSLDSGEIPEGANLYFTTARVRATDLTGFASALGAITAADTILSAFGKTQGRLAALEAGTSGPFLLRAGDTGTGAFLFTPSVVDVIPLTLTSAVGSATTSSLFVANGGATNRLTIRNDGRFILAGRILATNTDVLGNALNFSDAGTTNAPIGLAIAHTSTAGLGTAAAGFGVMLDFNLDSTTTLATRAVQQTATWTDPIHATRTAALTFFAFTGGSETTQLTLTNNQVQGGDGTVALPTFSSRNDTNSGTYFPAADTMGWTVGGAEASRLTTTSFTLAGSFALGATSAAPDVFLRRDAANIFSQRNAGTAQAFRVYETVDVFPTTTNYSRGVLQAQTAGNFLIRTEAAGTGLSSGFPRVLQVGSGPSVGTDVGGQTLILHAGQSTGNQNGGNIVLQSSAAGSSGASNNALVTYLTVGPLGATFASVVTVGTFIGFSTGGSYINSLGGNGILTLTNGATTDFTRLTFGGTSNSYNAFARDAVNGATLQSGAGTATWNDPSTAASGTVADRYLFGIAAPTLTSTNATVTYTRAASFYIGGAPTASTNVTIGTPYALFVDAGLSRFDGSVLAHGATAIPAGGTAGTGLLISSTANFGVFFGSGAPSLSAAKGSLYLRSDGSGATDRAYINTDGGTTWTALTTVG